MSLSLLGKIIEDKEITDLQEWAVLSALADATNKETMLCYPSLARISEVARCSRRTVLYVLNRMEKKGWIQVIRRRRPDGAQLANTYRVIKYGDHPGAIDALGGVQDMHLGSASRAPGVVPGVHQVVPPVHPTNINEPVIEPQPPAPAPARAKRPKVAADVGLLSLPLFLEGTDFRKALEDWVDHRKALRIPMTQRALEEVVKDCEKWGKEAGIQNIYLSIKKGWKGVYPKRDEPRPPKHKNDIF